MKNAKKILLFALALVALTLVMSLSIFAEETTEPTVYEFNDINSFKAAIASAQAGDIIRMTADTTVAQLNDTGAVSAGAPTNKAVIIDLNGFTLTTTSAYGGAYIGGGASIINGTIKHTGNTCAIKATNMDRIEDVTIIVESQKSNTGGISMRNHAASSNYAHINTIKNVKMIGTGNYGIETYGQGEGVDKTKPVIDLLENVEIDSLVYGLDLSCSVGTIKDCVISGSQAGISCKSSNSFVIALNLVGDNEIMGGNCAVNLSTYVTITADKYTDFVNTNGGAAFSASTTVINGSTIDIVGFSNENGVMTECAHTVVGGSCTERAECSVCGKAFDYVHTFVEDESKRELPNCTVQGKAYYNCACGATKEEFIARNPDAHEWVITSKDATCTEAATDSYNCKYGSCVGEEYTVETAPALGHSYDSVVTKPTCTEDGYTTHTCKTCGDTYTDSETAALGHNYVAGEEVDGKTVYTCTNCGDSYSCVHNYVETRLEPTEEAEGYIRLTCTECGEVKETILPKLVVYYVSSWNEFATAYSKCKGGETIKCTADFTAGQLNGQGEVVSSLQYLAKDIVIDFGGHTITTTSNWGGVLLGNDVSLVNGTLLHTGKTCAIKVFGAVKRIENLTITLQRYEEDLMLGGIVLQSSNNNTREISIDSIKNVVINGEDLSNGIETYNCGNQVDENGDFKPVIGGIENVTINSRQYGMWISANVGDIKNCTIHGDLAGIKFEGKGTGWAASANLINSTVDGNDAAVTVVYNGGNFSVTGDKYSTFSSESGVMFENAPVASENVTFDMVGVTVNEDGTLTFCPHTNVTEGDCDTQSECIDCTKVLGYVHDFVETSRVNSTCTVAGTVYYACACGATKEETLPYADHVYENMGSTAPTCMKEGYTTYTCVCGDTYNSDFVAIDPDAHNHVAGTPAADGSITYICNNKDADGKKTCNNTYVVNNAAINGEYYLGTDLVVFNNGVLTAMGGTFNYTYNVTTGMVDTNSAKINFVVRDGVIYHKGATPLHQHVGDFTVAVPTAPTCDKAGYTTYICKFCNTVIETVAGEAATGHNYVESNRVDAKPGVAGSVTYTCTNGCGSSYSETIDALPEHTHTEEIIPAVPSTSKTTGLTSGIKCSECGEIIVAPTTAVTGFKMNANLSLGEDISMYYNVVIPSSLNAKKAYMIVKMIGIDGTEQIITEAKYDASIGRYRFKYTGTKPQFMTDIMNAVVYVPDSNGIISAYEVPEYSVVQYLTGELKKAVAAKDAKLITLISDILYLGQQSQIFIGYKTSEAEWPTTIVAKQGYELTPSTFVKPDPSTSITKVNRDNCDTSIADWKNVGLLIGNSTKLQLVFAAPKLEGLTVKIYVSGVEQDVSYGDLENANLALDEKGRYILVLEGIKVSAYNLPIEAKFFDDDGNQVGSVLTTSVNSFVAANYDKKDAKIQAMLEAVYNYGLSVKAYFG